MGSEKENERTDDAHHYYYYPWMMMMMTKMNEGDHAFGSDVISPLWGPVLRLRKNHWQWWWSVASDLGPHDL